MKRDGLDSHAEDIVAVLPLYDLADDCLVTEDDLQDADDLVPALT